MASSAAARAGQQDKVCGCGGKRAGWVVFWHTGFFLAVHAKLDGSQGTRMEGYVHVLEGLATSQSEERRTGEGKHLGGNCVTRLYV